MCQIIGPDGLHTASAPNEQGFKSQERLSTNPCGPSSTLLRTEYKTVKYINELPGILRGSRLAVDASSALIMLQGML